MTPAELALPWRSFAIPGLAPWRLHVRHAAVETRLASTEVLALCAAVELGRVTDVNVVDLLEARAKAKRRWTFELLRGDAMGLRAAQAPGLMSLGQVLRQAGLELVQAEVRGASARREQAA